MVGMRVVEANDIFSTFTTLTLDANQFLGIDLVAIVRRVITSVTGARDANHSLGTIVRKLAQQHAAALVGIRFFAVLAKRSVDIAGNREHLKLKRSEVRLQRL